MSTSHRKVAHTVMLPADVSVRLEELMAFEKAKSLSDWLADYLAWKIDHMDMTKDPPLTEEEMQEMEDRIRCKLAPTEAVPLLLTKDHLTFATEEAKNKNMSLDQFIGWLIEKEEPIPF